MNEGIRAAVPGVPMAAVCRAMNAVLEAEGYGEYCHPPHIRRRGHGLGFGSIRPGDVSLDNDTVLAEGMLFMIHPNQHLPETGYLLCGEPVLLTARGAEPLTQRRSALAEIGLSGDRAVLTMHPTLLVGPSDWDPRGCRRRNSSRAPPRCGGPLRRPAAPSSTATARITPSSPISRVSRPSSKPRWR